jgi:catechol 2,3-dioxygenase-like lactoylglutathione lyase family enzyme
MKMQSGSTSFGSRFAQVAWVVKDIQATEKFFKEVIGVQDFVKMENLQAADIEGTYYGKPGNYTFHLYLAYSGDSMLELIQPVSGQSIYQDYLNLHPDGGVQHIAYMVPEAELDKAVSELIAKGFPVITSLRLPVASVAYFDTTKEIGVVTEIIGLTEAGTEFIQQLKYGSALATEPVV